MALCWDSTLNLTLDTISVLVTQYNNTAVTQTTTFYEDVSSVNISTLSQAQSIAVSVLQPIDEEYEPNGFVLNNGTNAFVDGSFTVAYPTPYIGIQGFEYISVTQQDPQCPKGLQMSEQDMYTTECACMMQSYLANPDSLEYTITSQITLSSTYYELAGNGSAIGNDLGTFLEGPVSINNVSFSEFIESALGSEGFNKYRSCAFVAAGFGPPALMMPVSALTATTTATVKSAGNYGIQSPKPGSPIAPAISPPTSTPAASPSVPTVEPQPEKKPPSESSTAAYVAPQVVTPVSETPVPVVDKPSTPSSPAKSPANQPDVTGSQGSVESPSDSSDTNQSGNNKGQNTVEPSNDNDTDESNAGGQSVAGEPSDNSNSEASGDSKSTSVAVVAISYAGSSITPDTSSQYNIPQVGKLSPGGSPVTTNNVVYSLAPSATALVSNGQTISLPTFAAAVPETPKQTATPALTFAGSTYTADSSSHIVIAGQTLVPGGPAVTVSSTPISLAHGASVAVVGGTTQSLYAATPTNNPELTFAGATYTANSDSAIIIQGQTLIPGSPAITISNTPISLAPGAGVAVIAGQTQSLTAASAIKTPVLTFAGSTYTADAASAFVVAGQTLSPGEVITVSNTPISLAAGGSVAVIAGQTQPLNPAGPTESPVLTFAGSSYTADAASAFVIAGQTLSPGGVITVSNTRVSLASGGSVAVIAGQTQSLNSAGPTATPVLTFAGFTYRANAASDFVIGGQTLSPGGVITVSNTRISLAAGGSVAVVAGSTQSLSLAITPTGPPTFTFNGATYTADSSSEFVIGSQTLSEGGVVTVGGTPISYAPNGGDVVVGTSTEAVGIGGLIMSGFGGGKASATGAVEFTGAGVRWKGEVPWWLVGTVVGGVLLMGLR